MMAALVLARNEPNRGISTCAQSGPQVAQREKRGRKSLAGREGQGRGWAAPDIRVLRKESDQNQKKGSHGRGPELQGGPLAHVDG